MNCSWWTRGRTAQSVVCTWVVRLLALSSQTSWGGTAGLSRRNLREVSTKSQKEDFRNETLCEMQHSVSAAGRTDWPSGGGLAGDGTRGGGGFRFTSTSGDFRSGKTLQETTATIRPGRVIWLASLRLGGIYKTSICKSVTCCQCKQCVGQVNHSALRPLAGWLTTVQIYILLNGELKW